MEQLFEQNTVFSAPVNGPQPSYLPGLKLKEGAGSSSIPWEQQLSCSKLVRNPARALELRHSERHRASQNFFPLSVLDSSSITHFGENCEVFSPRGSRSQREIWFWGLTSTLGPFCRRRIVIGCEWVMDYHTIWLCHLRSWQFFLRHLGVLRRSLASFLDSILASAWEDDSRLRWLGFRISESPNHTRFLTISSGRLVSHEVPAILDLCRKIKLEE